MSQAPDPARDAEGRPRTPLEPGAGSRGVPLGSGPAESTNRVVTGFGSPLGGPAVRPATMSRSARSFEQVRAAAENARRSGRSGPFPAASPPSSGGAADGPDRDARPDAIAPTAADPLGWTPAPPTPDPLSGSGGPAPVPSFIPGAADILAVSAAALDPDLAAIGYIGGGGLTDALVAANRGSFAGPAAHSHAVPSGHGAHLAGLDAGPVAGPPEGDAGLNGAAQVNPRPPDGAGRNDHGGRGGDGATAADSQTLANSAVGPGQHPARSEGGRSVVPGRGGAPGDEPEADRPPIHEAAHEAAGDSPPPGAHEVPGRAQQAPPSVPRGTDVAGTGVGWIPAWLGSDGATSGGQGGLTAAFADRYGTGYGHPFDDEATMLVQPPRDDEDDHAYADGPAPSLVRPYSRTGGRTKPGRALDLEALVVTTVNGREAWSSPLLTPEHVQVIGMCVDTTSVAEIAAGLTIPIGVARVIIADMVDLGLVEVMKTSANLGDERDPAFLRRVLSGLQRL